MYICMVTNREGAMRAIHAMSMYIQGMFGLTIEWFYGTFFPDRPLEFSDISSIASHISISERFVRNRRRVLLYVPVMNSLIFSS